MATHTLGRVQRGMTYAGLTDLTAMECPICHVTYALPSRLQDEAQRIGHGKILWYCPNGHQLGYHGKSAEEQERVARQEAQEEAKWYRQRFQAERDLRTHT